ncbi:DEAD/DEAH box helicase family protein [Marinospirillum minutulum]|uniref:DEAD/DEAH box helicase family protein n=1 Tax=Marinospirillum minutulum TaxID=64974 RepID=UPI000405AF21|nr:DEAD/DEAH box helicase family protein [Marinospirillum minutulum]
MPTRLDFRHHLILNQWLFSLFGFKSANGNFELAEGYEMSALAAFRERFQLQGEISGRTAEGEHYLIQRIREHLTNDAVLTDEQLVEYDRRIKNLTDTINLGRANASEEAVEWKYFQYLMLLFTEIYLDYFFTRPEDLVEGLNNQIALWNETWVHQDFQHQPLTPFNLEDNPCQQLNMLAFWSATGSGKTLVMHANILQYRFYLQRYSKTNDINKIILLTPNEGLTHQHIIELDKSGIVASQFSSQGGDLLPSDVVVIDINKLAETQGDKTVAVDSFGSNNLLLVDEGHRGIAGGNGGVWYHFRRKLASEGFTFEYSATFSQSAMNDNTNNILGTSLRDSYTKAILFDYSYRHFYEDGYGKQSQALNINEENEQSRFLYHTASLLSFYQQLLLFKNESQQLAPFNLEKPLWIFVTSKVTAGFSANEANDMVKSLQFLDKVMTDARATTAAINTLLNTGLVGAGGVNYLYGRFNYLNTLNLTAETIYSDLLEKVFNSTGGRLYIENITAVPGEIALRSGADSIPFGVINVGNASRLVKLCEEHGLLAQDARFGTSLFNSINQPDSSVNLLLGSRKFTEGWSSWRVSNMTLLNIGQNEGAQIIQLFGRGVRLKGWKTTLKRSSDIAIHLKSAQVERPNFIGVLETLNIFGQNADYIDRFRQELENEGIPVNEGLEEFVLPLSPKAQLPNNLNIIRVKETVANKAIGGAGTAFLELAKQVELKTPAQLEASEQNYFVDPARVILDFYPQVKGFATQRDNIQAADVQNQQISISHLALLDTRRLYFELLDFKRNKRWSNLTITEEVVAKLLSETGWYKLLAPNDAMELRRFENLTLWHDMAIGLLRKYCEMFYGLRRKQWEGDKLEYRSITENNNHLPGVNDANPNGSYIITLDPSKAVEDTNNQTVSLLAQLETIKDKLAANDIAWQGKVIDGLEFIWCEPHFYQPLVTDANRLDFKVSPVPLNLGEASFVKDLQNAYANNLFAGYEVYLLRNQTGQGAVGVFVDGGFYPDFILWLVKDGQQKVIFIDPKGLRNHHPNDPKVRFFSTIKGIEEKLNQQATQPKVELHAFLISETHSAVLESQWREYEGEKVTRALMESWNILFRGEDPDYVKKLIEKVK